MQLNGAQIVIRALREQGVDTIFGYPGGAVLEIYDALKESDIHHVLVPVKSVYAWPLQGRVLPIW